MMTVQVPEARAASGKLLLAWQVLRVTAQGWAMCLGTLVRLQWGGDFRHSLSPPGGFLTLPGESLAPLFGTNPVSAPGEPAAPRPCSWLRAKLGHHHWVPSPEPCDRAESLWSPEVPGQPAGGWQGLREEKQPSPQGPTAAGHPSD